MKLSKEKIAKILFEAENVYFDPQKPLRGGAGYFTPIYTDHRILPSFVKERNLIVAEMVNLIKEKIGLKNIDFILGIATSGIPLTSLIADRLKKPMGYIRKKPHETGKKNLIEGIIKKKDKILIIDDMINTGSGIIRVAETLRKIGAIVEYCVVIDSLETEETKKNMNKTNIKHYYLIDFNTLVDEGIKLGYLTKDDKKVIDDSMKDPLGWGKKMGFDS